MRTRSQWQWNPTDLSRFVSSFIDSLKTITSLHVFRKSRREKASHGSVRCRYRFESIGFSFPSVFFVSFSFTVPSLFFVESSFCNFNGVLAGSSLRFLIFPGEGVCSDLHFNESRSSIVRSAHISSIYPGYWSFIWAVDVMVPGKFCIPGCPDGCVTLSWAHNWRCEPLKIDLIYFFHVR